MESVRLPPALSHLLFDRLGLGRLAFEHPILTGAFWLAVLTYSISWWVTPFPPAVDYPQHLAIAAQLSRLANPGAPEWETLQPALLTYNGTFHTLTALLGLVLPVEAAGKVVLSLIAPLLAIASVELMAYAQRPRWTAFFILPFAYGHLVGWGFVNYALGSGLGLLVVVLWLRWRDGERHLRWWLVGLTLVLAYTHVLATICACLSIAVAYLTSGRSPRLLGIGAWARDAVEHAAPLLPAGLYAVVTFRVHTAAPNIFWVPEHDGTGPQAYDKVWNFAAYAMENLGDGTDVRLFQGTVAALVLLWVSPFFVAPSHSSGRREFIALTLFWGLAYLVTPRQFLSTGFIFERLPLWFVAFAVASAPVLGRPVTRFVAPTVAILGLLTALNVERAFTEIPGGDDASAVIDAIPEGSRVVAVMHDRDASPAVMRPVEVHLIAYYLVRKRGQLAFTFLRYASIPLRYKVGKAPPLYPGGIEWHPDWYRLHTAYGHHFTTVFVKTPDAAPLADPKRLTFGADAPRVREIAHQGRYWLYDVSDAVK